MMQRREISSQSRSFKAYVTDVVCDDVMRQLLLCVAEQTDVYVFSGVIRNFLLGYNEHRDFDLVVNDFSRLRLPLSLLRRCKVTKNKFGGYKLQTPHCQTDVWQIDQTWGIRHSGMRPNAMSLVRSAFFNFSAIAFHFNRGCFIFDDAFTQFYRHRVMDVVYEDNPYVETCILNTLHYAVSYNLGISPRLCRWIAAHYSPALDFRAAQQHRFGEQCFTEASIADFARFCKMNVREGKTVYVGR